MTRFKRITLLHSNDMHGDFLAETVDKNLIGGVSMLSGYINHVRKEEANTLYCIAGDMFRGSVIDSEFKGLSTIEIMNALAPDVVTIGNHETDYGIAHLLFLEKCAKFPIINANLYIKSNYVRLFQSHTIYHLDGMKILFIGIITESAIKSVKNDSSVGSFVDIHEAAQEIGKICNTYNATDIDLTVLLTHIGFEEDKKLAEKLDPAWGVDIIIGGHSHTFIDEPAIVNDIVIVQAGTGTDQIGRFDLVIDTYNNTINNYTWKTIPINRETCPTDSEIEKILCSYKKETDKKYNKIITRMHKKLTHPGRNQETEIGGLFADILAESLSLDLMFIGSGSIRTESFGPLIRVMDLIETFPYDSSVYLVKIKGKQLKHMLLYMIRDEIWQGMHSSFQQISKRFKVTYDIRNSELKEFLFDNKPVEEEKLYRVGLQQYQYINFERIFNIDKNLIQENGKATIIATSIRDILEEYLSNHHQINKHLDGRITLIR